MRSTTTTKKKQENKVHCHCKSMSVEMEMMKEEIKELVKRVDKTETQFHSIVQQLASSNANNDNSSQVNM